MRRSVQDPTAKTILIRNGTESYETGAQELLQNTGILFVAGECDHFVLPKDLVNLSMN